MDPQERRQQILERAGELFAAKGVAATTIREIGDAVGVRSGALYHYFPSKDAIVSEIVRVYLEGLVRDARAVSADGPAERIEALAVASLQGATLHAHANAIWRREGDYVRGTILDDAGQLEALFDEFTVLWSRALEDGVSSGVLRSDVDLRVVASTIRYAVFSATEWFTPTPERPIEAVTREIVAILLEGLLAHPR